MKWERIIPFETEPIQNEAWVCTSHGKEIRNNVDVRHGKEIDILSLKVNMVEDFSQRISDTRKSRTKIYQNRENLEKVLHCPICNKKSDDAIEKLNIYGARYCKCLECSHYFVLYRPNEISIREFYKVNKEYQSTYADKRTLRTRVEQVVTPKAKYLIEQYKKIYGRPPRSILDVGAGSGHFVHSCRQLGLVCEGIEISDLGRTFAKEYFDIDLIDQDFTKVANQYEYDIVTFWGVIEHVTQPVEMLKTATNSLGNEGMIVADVPRWNCFSTAVHQALPTSVVRHLDPIDHLQCFSDSSLATAFYLGGFDTVAAWYFGMDAYELLTQTSFILGENTVIEKMGQHLPIFQEKLDQSKLSDFMVFVGIPNKRSQRKTDNLSTV